MPIKRSQKEILNTLGLSVFLKIHLPPLINVGFQVSKCRKQVRISRRVIGTKGWYEVKSLKPHGPDDEKRYYPIQQNQDSHGPLFNNFSCNVSVHKHLPHIFSQHHKIWQSKNLNFLSFSPVNNKKFLLLGFWKLSLVTLNSAFELLSEFHCYSERKWNSERVSFSSFGVSQFHCFH